MDIVGFSEWLQDELERQGLTQADLVRSSGLSTAQISRILNMRSEPSKDALISIAYGLHLPPEIVFRAAGLLPDLPSPRDAAEEILGYKLQELSDRQIDELLKYIEFIQDRDSTLPTTTTPKQKREGSPQAAPSRSG